MTVPSAADLHDARALLARMEARGIRCEARGGRLYVGPEAALSDRLRGEMVEHRPALLALLSPPPPPPDPHAEEIAGRRRALIDDQGFPLCPECGGRALADGVRTCSACLAAERAA